MSFIKKGLASIGIGGQRYTQNFIMPELKIGE
jgi:sporulation-control protein spo0M